MFYINNAQFCYTIEDIVRAPGIKIAGVTAIPSGRYSVILNKSVRFNRIMPEILDVPSFSGIRIHWGNTALQTEGCPIVGYYYSSNVPNFISDSVRCFDAIFLKMVECLVAKEQMWITII
jgi:pseudouridine-5'-phosphate glycosidase